MATGTVTSFNPNPGRGGGFGWIQPDGGDKMIFVHVRDVQKSGLKSLAAGQRVGYHTDSDASGRRFACNITDLGTHDMLAAVFPSTAIPPSHKGTVKWFIPTKGYGFIKPLGGGRDVFVHLTAVDASGLGTLLEGQYIEYDLATRRGKTEATNLRVGDFGGRSKPTDIDWLEDDN